MWYSIALTSSVSHVHQKDNAHSGKKLNSDDMDDALLMDDAQKSNAQESSASENVVQGGDAQKNTVQKDEVAERTQLHEAQKNVQSKTAPQSNAQTQQEHTQKEPIVRVRPGMTWYWQLQGPLRTDVSAKVYDVDLDETPAQTIRALK